MAGVDTTSQSWGDSGDAEAPPVPGLLLVFSGKLPLLAPIPLDGEPLVLGRDALGKIAVSDGCLSRRHVEVAALPQARFQVRDLDSHNGVFVDGRRVMGLKIAESGSLLRIGDTLLILCADVSRYHGASVELDDGVVIGPSLRSAWKTITHAAAEGDCLHIRGETGAGKELAARHFDRASRKRGGPFVAINCATIPEAIAERLLFGAQRGAYSGAADALGYFQAADGGTLFLDEIAELGLEVQAKLLRVIETGQVVPLGATRPARVDVRFCSATHRDLARDVTEGRFRQDLYYRVVQSSAVLPPLRERREDIPWMAQAVASRRQPPLELHASLIEAALTRPWPGNVRELNTAMTQAVRAAGEARAPQLRAQHLLKSAGLALRAADEAAPQNSAAPDDAAIEAALRRTKVVAVAARELGMHRTQLNRWLARHPDVASFIRG